MKSGHEYSCQKVSLCQIFLSLAWFKFSEQATDEGNSIRVQALKCKVMVAYKLND